MKGSSDNQVQIIAPVVVGFVTLTAGTIASVIFLRRRKEKQRRMKSAAAFDEEEGNGNKQMQRTTLSGKGINNSTTNTYYE